MSKTRIKRASRESVERLGGAFFNLSDEDYAALILSIDAAMEKLVREAGDSMRETPQGRAYARWLLEWAGLEEK